MASNELENRTTSLAGARLSGVVALPPRGQMPLLSVVQAREIPVVVPAAFFKLALVPE